MAAHPQDSASELPVAGRRRRRVRGLILIASLLAVAYLAPAIVARTPLLRLLSRLAVSQLGSQLTIGQASLGWFRPVQLTGIEVRDRSGQPVLNVDSLVTQKTLLSLLMRRSDLGQITIARPRVQCVLRQDGSNVEDVLQQVMDSQPESTEPPPRLRLQIVDGAVEIQDVDTDRTWQCRRGAVSVVVGDERADMLVVAATCEMGAGNQFGQLRADLSYPMSESAAKKSALAVNLQTSSLPLDALQPLLNRWGVDLNIEGTVDAQIFGAWPHDSGSQSYDVRKLVARNTTLRSPTWLATDQLTLSQCTASGKLTLHDNRWQLENVVVQSDLGQLKAEGTIVAPSTTDKGWADLLANQDLYLAGDIDIARLSQMLPATLRIRDDTRLTSGRVNFGISRGNATSREEPTRWQANLMARDFVARRQGGTLRWDQPIELAVAVSNTSAGLIIDSIQCQSSFASVVGSGTLDDGSASIRGDLRQLSEEFSKFFDLGGATLQGQLAGKLNWQRGSADQVSLSGDLSVEQFRAEAAGLRPWHEELLAITLSASGRLDRAQARTSLESGFVRIRSAGDLLDVQLLAPVADPFRDKWPLSCRVAGELASWLPRLQAAAPLSGIDLQGRFDVTSTTTCSPQRIDIGPSVINVQDLVIRGAGWNVHEPAVKMELAGHWDLADGSGQFQTATLTSSAVALRADGTRLRWSARQWGLEGRTDLRMALDRLQSWFTDPQRLQDQSLAGQAAGWVEFTMQAEETTARCSLSISDFTLLRRKKQLLNPRSTTVAVSSSTPSVPVWRESKVILSGHGSYDWTKDLAQIHGVDLQSDTTNVQLAGQVRKVRTSCDVDLRGKLAYDWNKLTPYLGSYFGPEVRLAGQGEQAIAIRGPLLADRPPAVSSRVTVTTTDTTPAVIAEAGIGWSSAQVYGLQAGAGLIQAKLDDRVVDFTPINMTLSGGNLLLSPRMDFNRDPAVLTLAKGPVVRQLQITPAMCRSWLKYVAPLVAEATETQGSFSLQLVEEAVIPIADPNTSTMTAVLQIHDAKVGPGPLARDLMLLGQQVNDLMQGRPPALALPSGRDVWLQLPPQNLAFQVIQGRVVHRGLTLQVNDVVIRTEGSVGLDQSLAMVAEIPLQDQWIARQPLLAGFEGKAIRLPIQGTLLKPQIDRRALENMGRRMIGEAANRLLEDQINRGLNHLFGPPK